MPTPDYPRKIELQSPADFTYLFANVTNLAREKLDLHLPLSATNNETPDPMRERVRELVDEYIARTFTTASASISINGLDSSSPQFPFPEAFTAPETVEYEAYDAELASRVTALYAQLESLTTTVAQLRRDAPRRAARDYGAELARVIQEEDEAGLDDGLDKESTQEHEDGGRMDETADGEETSRNEENNTEAQPRRTKARRGPDPAWTLEVPLGTDAEAERWRSGEMAEVYEKTLRTLQRLQGDADMEDSAEGNALATTVGKAERAGRAADVVEQM
ncbi:kinetochore protein Mis14 like-domain-containing protein [Penicillium chermesinum]|uniref:Kinetochore protein Mis14 like-domain-containing protein n=1 Tax=Penicillium chermesinum TaxID=63820 RepID=A0A9W9P8W1_9EURO|nr:kinetochore protein Mis14 like-domain-containing protein [Penicillium chermesinum]KAJ5239880.1 kinetochore protein Mis14 like-domain-containing protein [Penicillium chermesinum]KAJ6166759.1 kinetochore protein Mis14 like-domain-containing protein [Penicillium chermesinum]